MATKKKKRAKRKLTAVAPTAPQRTVSKNIQQTNEQITQRLKVGAHIRWNVADDEEVIDRYDDLWTRTRKRPSADAIHSDLEDHCGWPSDDAAAAANIWKIVNHVRRIHSR
jgi:hypothetical protein